VYTELRSQSMVIMDYLVATAQDDFHATIKSTRFWVVQLTYATREPHSLCGRNEKRPEGATQIPWKGGRYLGWSRTHSFEDLKNLRSATNHYHAAIIKARRTYNSSFISSSSTNPRQLLEKYQYTSSSLFFTCSTLL